MSTQTVNVILPAPAGDVPVSDGNGNFNPQPLVLASNAASGPSGATPIGGAGTKVPWAAIDVGAPGVDVPITPKSTGRVRVIFSITVLNAGAAMVGVVARLLIGGVAQAIPYVAASIQANGLGELGIISFVAEVTLPVGATSNIEVDLTTAGASVEMYPEGATIDIQELPAATG